LKNGDQLSFGQSTRIFFLQGGPNTEEVEPVKTPSKETGAEKKAREEKEMAEKRKMDAKRRDMRDLAARKQAQAEESAEKAKKERERKRARKIAAGKDEDDADSDDDEEGIDLAFYKEYYGEDDDDEDEFYDRTASAKKSSNSKPVEARAETYDTLSAKKVVLEHQRRAIQTEIDALQAIVDSKTKNKEEEDLDAYMLSLSSNIEVCDCRWFVIDLLYANYNIYILLARENKKEEGVNG